MALAASRCAGKEEFNIASRMGRSHLEHLSPHVRPAKAAEALLEQYEEDSQKKLLTKWHPSMDLTQRMWLPPWLPPDAVGAKTAVGHNAQHQLVFIAAQFTDLKGACEQTRWFRSSEQWITCWWRCCVVVAPCEHLRWA